MRKVCLLLFQLQIWHEVLTAATTTEVTPNGSENNPFAFNVVIITTIYYLQLRQLNIVIITTILVCNRDNEENVFIVVLVAYVVIITLQLR